MSRSRDLANLAGDATGLETLTVSDITDLTATATELNYTDGVSSALQTQIDAKAPTASPTFTGTTTVADFVPATPLSHRNMIINGGMIIDQRNSGSAVSPSNSAYTIDRLQTYQAGGGAFSVQQQSSIVPVGFSHSAKINVDTIDSSIASGDYYMLTYNFEGYDTAHLEFGNSNAKTVTLSFYVRSSINGTFSGSITNNAGDRSYPFEYTINSANTWERKTITFQGDQTGTWPGAVNTKSIKIRLAFAMGSTYTASVNSWGAGDKYASPNQVNLMATQNNTFYITGLQLELGSVATPFEHRSYGEELTRCQRYYKRFNYSSGNRPVAIGIGKGSSKIVADLTLPVTMRSQPSTAVSSYTHFKSYPNNTVATGGNTEVNTTDSIRLVWNVSGVSTYNGYEILANESAHISAESEL
jgi:hypothetical protein